MNRSGATVDSDDEDDIGVLIYRYANERSRRSVARKNIDDDESPPAKERGEEVNSPKKNVKGKVPKNPVRSRHRPVVVKTKIVGALVSDYEQAKTGSQAAHQSVISSPPEPIRRSIRLVVQKSIKDAAASVPTPETVTSYADPDLVEMKVEIEPKKKAHDVKLEPRGTSPPAKRSTWDQNYSQLVQCKKKYGSIEKIPRASHSQIYKWMASQRYIFKKNKLPTHHLNKLKQIGFDFAKQSNIPKVSSEKKITWDDSYAQLIQYKTEYGSIRNIPYSPSHTRIHKWMTNQRGRFIRGELPAHHIVKLKEIDFDFAKQSNMNKVSWEERYQELIEYKKKYGHCDVSALDVPSKASAGLLNWVHYQRKSNNLSDDARHRLSKIGFRFSVKGDAWDDKFRQLQEFMEEHGHDKIPTTDGKDSSLYKLATWTRHQRKFFRNGTLLESRCKRLKKIGFQFHTDRK